MQEFVGGNSKKGVKLGAIYLTTKICAPIIINAQNAIPMNWPNATLKSRYWQLMM